MVKTHLGYSLLLYDIFTIKVYMSYMLNTEFLTSFMIRLYHFLLNRITYGILFHLESVIYSIYFLGCFSAAIFYLYTLSANGLIGVVVELCIYLGILSY